MTLSPALLRILLRTAAAAAALCAPACSDDCIENHSALPLAGFYPSSKPTQKVSIDSIRIEGVGAPHDSVLSPAYPPKSEVYLPFRIDSDTTAFIFRYMQAALTARDVTDTVRFVYTRTPRLASAQCGVSYLYDIRSIQWTGRLIDSVVCPGGFIDNTNAENLRIYFAIQTQEPGQ